MTASTGAPPPRGITRRAALCGAVALGVAATGCTDRRIDEPGGRPLRREVGTDPDVALAAEALAGEALMLSRIQATARRHRGLRADLLPSIDVHTAHVRLLRDAAPDRPDGPPSAEPPPGDTTTVPRDPARAMRRLSLQEDRLSLANRQSSFAAKSGDFARVLASMAAAAAQQSIHLGRLPEADR